MTPLTSQQVFDRAASHLLKQGFRSELPDRSACAYRGRNGMMCAVGALIPDEMYDPAMEKKGVGAFPEYFPEVFKHISGEQPHLICDLQEMHDHWEPSSWRKRLGKIAKSYHLDDSVLTKV